MKYLVETKFKDAPTPEILALIPAESAHGKALDAQGIRLQLYVAADQSAAWQVFQGKSLAEVQGVVNSFPLARYVMSTIIALADDQPSS